MSDTSDTRDRVVEAYKRLGTISGTARAAGVDRVTVRRHLRKVGLYDERPMFAGRMGQPSPKSRRLPGKGKIKRYLLTSAQNNTLVAAKVWETILTIRDHYDAELMVGTFSYNKASYSIKSTKRNAGPTAADKEDLWFDPEVEEYITDEPVQLAPGLVWCGEMNILPTAVRPLSGLEVYTGRQSGIFPHAKRAMDSVASGKYEPTKFNYTTGTVTKRNYIQKKAGLKAEFHHVYGALLVEVDSDSDWFVREITVDNYGTAYDLDLCFKDGKVTSGHRVETITWGDIHVAEIDQDVAALCWGEGGIADTLRPCYQMMHDVLDFRARNLHNVKRGLIHDRFQAYVCGHDSVEEEIGGVATFIEQASRPWCKTIVVDSNHNNYLVEWLRVCDYRSDPINAIYFLEAQLHMFKSIAAAPYEKVNLLKWAVERASGQRENVIFLGEDESFVVKNIEHGMHGHLGPNGARGTATNLARMGRKMNRGHSHSAGIVDGVYTAGVTGKLDQGYNKGPSSWSASHILTYPNGKRTIITMWNGKWRAG